MAAIFRIFFILELIIDTDTQPQSGVQSLGSEALGKFHRHNEVLVHGNLETSTGTGDKARRISIVKLFKRQISGHIELFGSFKLGNPVALGDIAGGQIRSITYYTSSTATLDFDGAEFDVYMAEVEQASFSSATFVDWTTLGTPVYSGTVSLANSKMTITFPNDFSYNGGKLVTIIKCPPPY